MSIAGRRKRKMVLIWFAGVLSTVVIGVIVMLLLQVDIIGNTGKLFDDYGFGKEEKVHMTVASRMIEAGKTLEAEDLEVVEVPISQGVSNNLNVEELIGKQTVLNIDKMLPLTEPMVREKGHISDKERLYEFDYISVPNMIAIGDVIDVRILFPNGQDYVILSKKEIVELERDESEAYSGLVGLTVDEDEMLRMSSALVDMILTETAEIYMVKYVDPFNQEAAMISYPVNRSVLSVLLKNPNLVLMPNMAMLTENRALLDSAMKELLDEDDEWFSMFMTEADGSETSEAYSTQESGEASTQIQETDDTYTSGQDNNMWADQIQETKTLEEESTTNSEDGF